VEPSPPYSGDSTVRRGGTYADVWKHPYFRQMTPIGFISYGGMISIQSLWAGPWLVRVAGYEPLAAAGGLFTINMCMLLAFWCWGMVNPWLQRNGFHTDRLIAWANYERFTPKSKANPPPAPGRPHRMIAKLVRGKPPPFIPFDGDVVIVGNGKRHAGDHVTINMGYDEHSRSFETISGNGGGLGPRGDKREGISRREYAIDTDIGYRAMWIIRPAETDLK
jgi:hypothetical protein